MTVRITATPNHHRFSRRTSTTASLLVVALLWLGTTGASFLPGRAYAAEVAREAAGAPTDVAAKQQRQERLAEMRRRAETTKVSRLDDKGTRLELHPEPLFRSSDEPRRITDMTVWAWGTKGRPVALQKVQNYRWPGSPQWFHCFVSTSEGLIEAEFPDGEQWRATKPGLVLRPLPDGPDPAANPSRRLTQMRNLAERFSATLWEPLDNPQQMRLVRQPILRYSDPASGLQDGVVFALATNGTHPDTVLFIELDNKQPPGSAWKFALVGMTCCLVKARLDQQEVWCNPYVEFKGPRVAHKQDNWLFFFEKGPPLQ